MLMQILSKLCSVGYLDWVVIVHSYMMISIFWNSFAKFVWLSKYQHSPESTVLSTPSRIMASQWSVFLVLRVGIFRFRRFIDVIVREGVFSWFYYSVFINIYLNFYWIHFPQRDNTELLTFKWKIFKSEMLVKKHKTLPVPYQLTGLGHVVTRFSTILANLCYTFPIFQKSITFA